MTPATRVSLALLWERWQEIEELPEHDKTVLAELNVLEARIIEQPAKNARDLVAKLKFLAHIARDHDWDDKLEKLHASILSAQEDFLRPEEGPLDRLSQAIRHFKGIGECLESVAPNAPDPEKVCEYLGRELGKHAAIADAALGEIYADNFTKRVFLKETVALLALFGASEGAAGETSSTTSSAAPVLDPVPESFAAAEKEIADLWAKAEVSSGADEVQEPLTTRIFALETWIAITAPTTLAEAAIKLRRLADPHTGIEIGDADEDPTSVRQILAFVEAELADKAADGGAA